MRLIKKIAWWVLRDKLKNLKDKRNGLAPNWFSIGNKWYHYIVVIENGFAEHYIDGQFSHKTKVKNA